MAHKSFLQLPAVSLGAEYLVMGHLLRRNIMTYKAPPGNEGYDLICLHPDPRHQPAGAERSQIRVQVKSRYATDCNRSVPFRQESMSAFDFVIVVFLNIGKFMRGNSGLSGANEPEYITVPNSFVVERSRASRGWKGRHMLRVGRKDTAFEGFKGEKGFEQIALALGVGRPSRTDGA